MTEALIMTSVIDAEERQDKVMLDITNAFVQTTIENRDEKIIMRISGQLAQLLPELNKSEKIRNIYHMRTMTISYMFKY